MSLFGFFKNWGSDAARINNSDKMIETLVGINPKSYHPDIYKGVLQETLNYEKEELAGKKLNLPEFSAIRIGFFSLIAENAEDFEVVQIYVDALGRLSRACINEIGWQVSMQLVEFKHELSCKDSFYKNK